MFLSLKATSCTSHSLRAEAMEQQPMLTVMARDSDDWEDRVLSAATERKGSSKQGILPFLFLHAYFCLPHTMEADENWTQSAR